MLLQCNRMSLRLHPLFLLLLLQSAPQSHVRGRAATARLKSPQPRSCWPWQSAIVCDAPLLAPSLLHQVPPKRRATPPTAALPVPMPVTASRPALLAPSHVCCFMVFHYLSFLTRPQPHHAPPPCDHSCVPVRGDGHVSGTDNHGAAQCPAVSSGLVHTHTLTYPRVQSFTHIAHMHMHLCTHAFCSHTYTLITDTHTRARYTYKQPHRCTHCTDAYVLTHTEIITHILPLQPRPPGAPHILKIRTSISNRSIPLSPRLLPQNCIDFAARVTKRCLFSWAAWLESSVNPPMLWQCASNMRCC